MESELVSIVIPIYNVEAYLERCLKSVLAQIYRPLQVILVNDGSTDRSAVIAKRFSELYPDVFEYISQDNQGLGPARNVGIAQVRGEWFCLVDSDDYLDPEYVSGMLSTAHAQQADVVVCNFKIEWQNGFRLLYPFIRKRCITGVQAARESLNFISVPSFAWNKLYATRMFRASGVAYPAIYYEDIAVMAQLMLAARTVALTNKAYYYYCRRRSSLTGNFKLRNIHGFTTCVSLVGHALRDHGLLHSWRSSWNGFLKRGSWVIATQILFRMSGKTLSERLSLVREVKATLSVIDSGLCEVRQEDVLG